MIIKTFRNLIYFTVAVACLFELLLYTGFCFKQFRYIPDEEKVRIAIEFIIKENRKTVAEYKERAVAYPFSTVDEFFANNPISYGASSKPWDDLDWLRKMCGNLSAHVVLEFTSIYKGSPEKQVALVSITNCGDPAWED